MSVTLTGTSNLTFPVQFCYKLPEIVKRFTVNQTAGDIRIQIAPAVIPGDSIIEWTCKGCTRAEWDAIKDYYLARYGDDLTFTGYWGDVLSVKFLKLDDVDVKSMIFDLSGSFNIMSITTWGTDIDEP